MSNHFHSIEATVNNRKKKIFGAVLTLFAIAAIGVVAFYNVETTQTLNTAATPITAAATPITAQSDDDCEGDYCETYSRVVIGDGYECNDGTEAVFYIDEASSSSPNYDKWYIELPGGSTCGTVSECDDRWVKRPWDMSTNLEDPASFGSEGGFDSADPNLNPNFHDYHRVVIHYCTSDAHMGQVTKEESETDWSFLGATNAFGMLERLASDYPAFLQADTYLLNGVSVGGTGILNLADAFEEYLDGVNPQATSYYISDCGWDLVEWDCVDDCTQVSCPEEDPTCNDEDTEDTEDTGDSSEPTGGLGGDTIEKNEFYNANCIADGQDSYCSYGEIVFKYLNTAPHFVISQQLYDSQMMPWDRFLPVDGWTDYMLDFCYARTDYVISSYEENEVTSVFSSNCRTHDFTEKNAVYTTYVTTTHTGHELEDHLPSLMTDFLESNGAATFWFVDDDHNPEGNPTCDLTILEEPPEGYVYESCSECVSIGR